MKRVEIAVVADDRVLLFGSIAAAERHIDAQDVRSGRITAVFDRDGRPHDVRIDDNGWGLETVRLAPVPGAPPEPDALRARLDAEFRATGRAIRPDLPLDEILHRAAALCRA